MCSFHEMWSKRDDEPDRTYHRKIALGLLEPVASYLDEDEINATLRGRSRRDGRRLDAYCLDEPLGSHPHPDGMA